MDCPQCRGYKLEPIEIEKGLVGAICAKCSGTLLPLLNYRYWSGCEHTVESVHLSPEDVAAREVEDNHHALVCPKCSRLMIKYNIGLQSRNKLDLCANCDEAWLDKGEWDLLKGLGYHEQLPNIFTDVWQRDIRKQRQAAVQRERFESLIGKEDFEKINQFKMWLEDNDHKDVIKQYLMFA